jgi:hypothetical protein
MECSFRNKTPIQPLLRSKSNATGAFKTPKLGPPEDVERWGVNRKSDNQTKIKKTKMEKNKSERRRTILLV